jgi:hypothetical protein
MYQDLFLQLDFQAAITTTGQSSKYIDTLAAGDAMPDGTVIIFKSFVTTTFTSTAGTLQVQLQSCATTNFASDASTVSLVQSASVPFSSLVTAGAQAFTPGSLPSSIPSPLPTKTGYIIAAAVPAFGMLRYLQAYYFISAGAGTVSAGAITSELVITTDKLLSATLGLLMK